MKLLVHIEQYDVVGILPSQLESLSLLCTAMGVTQAAYIDNTLDGFPNVNGFAKYTNLKTFLKTEDGPFVVFTTDNSEDIRERIIPKNAWMVFGPAMGFKTDDFDNIDKENLIKVKLPGGVLNSRDVVPIALWHCGKWQVQ